MPTRWARVMTRTYQPLGRKGLCRLSPTASTCPVKKAFKDFSRGMRMKLAIAVALSPRARSCLVLDEATAGLDPIVRDEVLEIVQRVHPGGGPLHPDLLPHSLATWKSFVTTSPFSTRGGCCSARRRTACLDRYGLLSGTAEQVDSFCSRRPWCAKESPVDMAASGAWSGAATWPPPAASWNGPRWRTSFSFW